MNKEELIKENARLGQANKEWAEADAQRRNNLSEMLNAPQQNGYYGRSTERTIYSWPEIYFALGKLTAKKDYAEFDEVINRHEMDISSLCQWRNEEIAKNKRVL